MATEFGQQVLETELTPEARRNAARQVQEVSDQGAGPVAVDPVTFIDGPITKLSTDESRGIGPLSSPPPMAPVALDSATDSAITETLAEGQQVSLEARIANNAAALGAFDPTADSINNVVIEAAKRQFEEGIIQKSLGFDILLDPNTPLQQKQDILRRSMRLMDLRKATLRENVAWDLVTKGFGGQTGDFLSGVRQQFDIAEIQNLRENAREPVIQETRNVLNAAVAGYGWDSFGEAVADLSIQEMTPIYNVATKIGLTREVMDAMGMPKGDKPWFLLGSGRHNIRAFLTDLSDDERLDAITAYVQVIDRLKEDPANGWWLRKFNVLELSEAILSDDVINGTANNDVWDKWFGNFEAAAEAVFTGFVAKRVGKFVRGVFTANEEVFTINRVARQAANRRAQTKLNNATRGKVADEQGAGATAVDTSLDMPRPSEFVDDRVVLLPGVAETVARTERIAGKLHEATAGRLARVLGPDGRANTADKLLDTMQLGNRAEAVPAMSIIEETADGVHARVVLSKTGQESWRSLDELIPDLAALDPDLEVFRILRRGDDGKLVEVPLDDVDFAKRVTQKDLTNPERSILDDEFFLEFDEFRAYHPADKTAFTEKSLRNTFVPRVLLTPNAKHGDDIYGAFQDAHLTEAVVNKLTTKMFDPYYKLNLADKRVVGRLYEWAEDFGKTEGRSPNLYDFLGEHPDMTPKQMSGLVALNRGYEVQFELLDRRMFLEFNGLGYKTARPRDGALPRFHGKALDQAEVKASEQLLNPVTGEYRVFEPTELARIYNDGGSVMKLDVTIDVAKSNGKLKSSFVVLHGNDYNVGKLSRSPLEHYPGYSFRFYDNPYFINKVHKGVQVDGKRVAGDHSEAFRSAGSQLEAEGYLGRIADRVEGPDGVKRWIDKDDGVTEYSFSTASDLSQTDRTLAQKQALQREGRLFWDSRNRNALPDVYGNTTPMVDFTKSIEKGTRLAARQNAEEDVMRALKNAFNQEYGTGPNRLIKVTDLKAKGPAAIIADLKTQLSNAVDKTMKARLTQAIERAQYIKQMSGVQSGATPWMRKQVLRMAVGVDRFVSNRGFKSTSAKPANRAVERFAQTMDPMRKMRSVAFNLFMVLRPFRQAVLQASQTLFLAGIDPVYVLSGKGHIDSIAMKLALRKIHQADFSDVGYSFPKIAKMMGLKTDELKLLIKKLDDEGIVDIVGAHTFSGGSSEFRRVALPKEGSLASTAWYGAKAATNGTLGFLKKAGFEFGESINKIGSYNIAWRRVMKNKKYKSLKQLTDDDWRQVVDDTENLSLAMTQPNAAGYQQGIWSVTTQFLAFTHKLTLAMLGQNPALSAKEVTRMWVMSTGLFGARAVGLRDEVEENLRAMGLGDSAHDNTGSINGETLVDILSVGAIQTFANKVIKSAGAEPVDTENFTPVPNMKQIYQMTIESFVKDPSIWNTLGPFGNRVKGFMAGLDYVMYSLESGEIGENDQTTLLRIMDTFARNMVPQWSDISSSWLAHETGKLYSNSGEHLEISPSDFNLFLRGTLGVRTEQETSLWDLRDKVYSSDEIVGSIIKDLRKMVKNNHFRYERGDITQKVYYDSARAVARLAKLAPEGRRMEVIEGVWLEDYFVDDDPSQSPMNLIVDAMLLGRVSKGQALQKINELGLSPSQKQMALDFADEVYSEDLLSDEDLRKQVLEQLPTIRD